MDSIEQELGKIKQNLTMMKKWTGDAQDYEWNKEILAGRRKMKGYIRSSISFSYGFDRQSEWIWC